MASLNFQLCFFEYLKKKSFTKSIKIDQVIDNYRKKTSGHIWKPERLVTSSTPFLFFICFCFSDTGSENKSEIRSTEDF